MTQYISYWLPGFASPELPATAAPQAAQLVLTPHGQDGEHYWKLQAAPLAALGFKATEGPSWAVKEGAMPMLELHFETTQAQQWSADEGLQPMVDRLTTLRPQMAAAGMVEVVGNGWGLLPGDFADLRAKTADECQMDTAMLLAEGEHYAQALVALQAATGGEGTAFWHSVARRVYANRAQSGHSDDASADWEAAEMHAQRCIVLLAPNLQEDTLVYGFGDDYKDARCQLAAAATTVAQYWLQQCQDAQQAMVYIDLADITNRGGHVLYALKVSALLQLGRQQEAFETHLRWRLAMPEVQNTPAYIAYVQGIHDTRQQAEQARIGALKIVYGDGTPATAAELEALQQRFPQLPAAYLQWLAQPARHHLTVIDGSHEETYDLCSVPKALDSYESLQTWYTAGEYSDPEDVAELMDMVREEGFDPKHLLPIVESAGSTDCFVLRTDGVDPGKVFFWSHEELATLTEIVGSVDALFPRLEAQAKAGHTFVL